MKVNPRWLKYAFKLCMVEASMSKDPSTKVGAVIIRPDGSLSSSGWNGFPPGYPDREADYLDREVKYSKIIHAEINAILGASEKLTGFTLVTWPLPPCERCAPIIVKAGITKVIFPYIAKNERWSDSCEKGKSMFTQCGVKVIEIDLLQLGVEKWSLTN
jgi:dCMP deaminase